MTVEFNLVKWPWHPDSNMDTKSDNMFGGLNDYPTVPRARIDVCRQPPQTKHIYIIGGK